MQRGEISEKTAGPSYQGRGGYRGGRRQTDEDEESMVERRAPRPAEEDDEDNTLSLAQWRSC